MSSTIPLPPREQLYNEYCSNNNKKDDVTKCPPLSPSPHANSFIVGAAVINKNLTIPPPSPHAANSFVIGTAVININANSYVT
jgi:hypothetical protein